MSSQTVDSDELPDDFWSNPDNVFKLFDTDQNGTLSRGELQTALTSTIGKKILDTEVDKLMTEFDINHDGVLDLTEFKQICQKLETRMRSVGHKKKRMFITASQNKEAVSKARMETLAKSGNPNNASGTASSTDETLLVSPTTEKSDDPSSSSSPSPSSSPSSMKAQVQDFVENLPPQLQPVKGDIGKVMNSLTASELDTLANLKQTLDKKKPPPAAASKLVVDIIKNRIPSQVYVTIKDSAKEEGHPKIVVAISVVEAVSEAELLSIADTVIAICGKITQLEATNAKPQVTDIAPLVSDSFFAAIVDVYKVLPSEVKEEVFSQIPAKDKKAANFIAIFKSIMDQPTDHLVRIISPAFSIAANLLELQQQSASWSETESSLKKMNELVEKGIAKCSKLVARLHHELVALPQSIQEAALNELPPDARKAADPVLELANGMIEKDVEELFVTMAHEAFPKKLRAPEPPQQVVLSVDHSYDAVTSSEEEKAKFEKQFKEDLAKSLGIPVSRINITNLSSGSVIVKFKISGNGDEDDDDDEMVASELVAELQRQVEEPTSSLYQGSITSKAKNEVAVEVLPMPEETEEERKAKASKQFREMLRKGLTVGKVIARTESRRLLKWVANSPTSLRALSFLAGLLVLFGSTFSFIFDLFSGQFSAFLISFWLMGFSIMIILTEAKVKAFESFAAPFLRAYFQILGTVEGRGHWLVFVGMLAASLITKGEWQNALNFGFGVFAMLIGVASVINGKIAKQKLSNFKDKLHGEVNIRVAFQEADVNRNGSLDVEELGVLCQKLGSQMSQNQLEASLRTLDTDNSGGIDYNEFLVWFRGPDPTEPPTPTNRNSTPATPMAEIKAAKLKAKATPSLLLGLNLLGGVSLAVSGLVGAFSIWSGHPESLLVSMEDLWCVVGGLSIIFLETSAEWCTCAFCKAGERQEFERFADSSASFSGRMRRRLIDENMKFLDTVAGRGVFYLFLSALAIASYEKDIGLGGLTGIFTGLFLMVVGAINVVKGMSASAKFKELQSKIALEHLDERFKEADLDGSGELDFEELGEFCKKLGMDFTHREWELLVESLDADNSGTVSLQEFKQWLSRETL
ncbi:hypothetical protein TrVE_jg4540 [Triparma verrucosa]|uniref:EF-hand domain-containing protein n=1 Tax=Triparma verrucosa TaxID=1606542 RepID=A0A9W7C2T8_9STRA|nr:hypothetical protein TrVE_jg4540 [Triparma verrucosa]